APPIYPLFPYTTLFRSQIVGEMRNGAAVFGVTENAGMALAVMTDAAQVPPGGIGEKHVGARVELGLGTTLEPAAESGKAAQVERSEEHTSELQSRSDLV